MPKRARISPSLWPTRFRGCDAISSLSRMVGSLKLVVFGSAAAATFWRTAGEVVDVGKRAGRGAANGDCTVGRPKSRRATSSQPVSDTSATPMKHLSCAVRAITTPVDMPGNAPAVASAHKARDTVSAQCNRHALVARPSVGADAPDLATGLPVPRHKRIELCFWQVWGDRPSSLKVRRIVLSQK